MKALGPVVTLGEVMMVFNGAAQEALGVGSQVGATFAGAEANVAIGLARLGHAVKYLTLVGADSFGKAILLRMAAEGVDVSGCRGSARGPTGVMFKERRDPECPKVLYYRRASAFAALVEWTIEPAWREAGVIFLTGITPALSDTCRRLMWDVVREAREREIPVWLDPNLRAMLWGGEAFATAIGELLPYVDTVLPNEEDARWLTGETAPRAVAGRLMERGVRRVVFKAGERGAFVFSAEGETHCPRFEVPRVMDPVGAGDAFDAGFLSADLDGLAAGACLRRGHAVAARVCETLGDWEGLPTRAELEAFLAGR
jgi:2-dehydro-3-deoxygluconokinase